MTNQHEITTLDLAATLAHTVQVAEEAAHLLRDHFARPRQYDRKSSQIDLVTEADRETEALIVRQLRALYPAHQIVGEEGGSYSSDGATAGYRWFVDPLDGTTNFAHRLPIFSVSLALAGGDGLPLVGVVYDVMRRECFAAAKGRGATLNGQPIHVSDTPTLAVSMMITGFPYDRWTDPENNIEHWGNFVLRAQGERCMGSAALDLAYIAAGRGDGYWESKLHPWDIMAGALLVTEAGGRVTDYLGNPDVFSPKRPKVVASNGHIHDEMLQVLALGKDAPRPGI